MATRQLGTPPLRPNDIATREFVEEVAKAIADAIGGIDEEPEPELTPAELSVTGVTATSITVKASGDPEEENFGEIQGYNFYVGGVKHNSTLQSSTYTYTDRTAETAYTLTFTFVNDNDEESAQYGSITVTTPAVPDEGEMVVEDREAIDQIVADAMADGMGPGVLVSVTGPKGVYEQAYGYASRATNARPISLDDHMRIGSATKTFTGLAVMRCIDQGLMSLDDTLDMFNTIDYQVSEVPNSDRITVRHMLMHRSGVYDYMTNSAVQIRFYLLPGATFTVSNILNTIVKGNPIDEPGAGWHYTNSNTVLLGLCVRAVTGRDIRDVIIEDIITPLGLTETTWPTTNAMPEPYAEGYGGGGYGQNTKTTGYNVPALINAAGAIVSTIRDLQAWGQAMRDGSLVSPEALELFETEYCPVPFETPFAPTITSTPFGLARVLTGTWHGHIGSVPGYECVVQYDAESGAVIAVMENSQGMGSDGVAIATWTRVAVQIAELLYPGSNDTVEIPSCGETPAPAAPVITGAGAKGNSIPAAFAFTAPEGADVWAVVTTDRNLTISGATYGGAAMTQYATVNHRDSAAYGTTRVYRLEGGGDGTAKNIQATGSGSGNWAVQSIYTTGTPGTAVVETGTTNSTSQEIPGVGLYILGARARAIEALAGGKTRSAIVADAATQVISTTTYPTTFQAVLGTAAGWGGIFIPITDE